MLECKLCDYHQKIQSGGSAFFKCEFSSYVFIGQKGYDLKEYPCRNRSYNEYLQRRTKKPAVSKEPLLFPCGPEETEKKVKSVYHLTGNDWHFFYLNRRKA